jgi:hypothetical protein
MKFVSVIALSAACLCVAASRPATQPADSVQHVKPAAPKPVDKSRLWEKYATYRYSKLNDRLDGILTPVFRALGDSSNLNRYFEKDRKSKKFQAYREFILAAFTDRGRGSGDVGQAMFLCAVIGITPPDVLLAIIAPEIGPKGKFPGLLNGKDNGISKHIQRQANQGHSGPPNFTEYVLYLKGGKDRGLAGRPNTAIIINHMFISDPHEAFASMLQADYGLNPHIKKHNYLHCKKEDVKEIRRLQQETADIKDHAFRKRYSFMVREDLSDAVATHLKRLAGHEKWWVRLYVAGVITNHRKLRTAELMKVLKKDANEHVRAAMARLAKEKT